MIFYLETNRQDEIANQEIERYFCTFVNYQQDDWLGKLAIIEFVANNNELASTKLSPFFATKSLYIYMSFDKVELFNANTCKQIFNQKALDISRNMQITWKFV